MVRIWLTAILFSLAGRADVVKLSQRDVAEKVLKESNQAYEANLTSQLSRYAYIQVLAAYDLSLTFESYLSIDKQQSIIASSVSETNANVSSLKLSKPFITGTTVSLDGVYNRTTPYPFAGQTLNQFGITLTQNLWKNFFGISDRAAIRAAEETDEASLISRGTALQAVVLDGIKLFWKTYVAQENFREALASRERYEKLVDEVKRKTSFGYAAPGEYAQVQAELETRNQNVKNESTNYLATTDQLLTRLKLPLTTEIQFAVPNEVPNIPTFPELNIENLRAVRAQRMKLQAAEDNLRAAYWKDSPDFSLVAKVYQNGVDPDTNNAYNETISGVNPMYYVGVKFTHSFGSGNVSEEALNKKILKEIERSKYERLLLETRDFLSDAHRKVQASYAVALSMKKQKGFREKAAQELQKSYNQGRTDIATFINALNSYFASLISYSKSVGDYQIALNEYASLRDELVSDTNTEVKR
jgi:outer membrane protein TolC